MTDKTLTEPLYQNLTHHHAWMGKLWKFQHSVT